MFKRVSIPLLVLVLMGAGCAHNPQKGAPGAANVVLAQAVQPQVLSDAAAPVPLPRRPAVKTAAFVTDEYGDIEIPADATDEERVEIADPLEPFNRAMYHFNDRLYFWLLKPVAQGYAKVVPETARVGVSNFFSNLAFPIRFVNNLLQANFAGAAEELGRFVVNTLWGVGGLLDPAADEEINLVKQEQDLGLTLGSYGIGHGFFINWPLFGPSSPRDTLGLIGDGFLSPSSYLNPWYAGAGVRGYGIINKTSLNIGDYESLKEAAIDPYVAIRNAYVQYRLKKIPRKEANGPDDPALGTATISERDAFR